ncbi:DNA polymerase III subunit epsilon [Motiliproteus coralliicola]|uniref:DNA polymerase III subunit epsilon n=1 Tax=Motiliproteus coralliicola TaxID=2283196 RepID=A0A369WUJ0_9GAMM|nr:DNA polymerase III subunit epsilon [Motiliproteus coralliicola]RDE24206.1 DNA polymerase III subunit epsilon [Motiliproteus coralliicola]
MRQIVLDTETTGIEPREGHRIIEIGGVEMIDRKLTGKTYHRYINPQRDVPEDAIAVHGITNEFLEDKPFFADVMHEFQEFIRGAELVIHNAPFDVGFLNHEFMLVDPQAQRVEDLAGVLDTLAMARKMRPGQRNTLDALCKHYMIDNSQRTLHGALLDSEILADVYLMMTGGQTSLMLGHSGDSDGVATAIQRVEAGRYNLMVAGLSDQEQLAHEQMLDRVDKKSGGSIWRQLEQEGVH